jgi:hypothetical protein
MYYSIDIWHEGYYYQIGVNHAYAVNSDTTPGTTYICIMSLASKIAYHDIMLFLVVAFFVVVFFLFRKYLSYFLSESTMLKSKIFWHIKSSSGSLQK